MRCERGIRSLLSQCLHWEPFQSLLFLLVFSAMAGVGFVLGLVIAIIIFVVALFRPNALQDWLSDTVYGFREKSGGRKFQFKGLADQQLSLESMSKGEG